MTKTEVASAIAVCVSLFSLYFSWRAHQLANQQEKRRQPNLQLEVINSGIEKEKSSCIYDFKLSVKNPTDSDNAVSSIYFYLTYLTPSQEQITIKLSPSYKGLIRYGDHIFETPTQITAHDTIEGWCCFHISKGFLTNNRIVSHKIILTDSQNKEYPYDVPVQEPSDET